MSVEALQIAEERRKPKGKEEIDADTHAILSFNHSVQFSRSVVSDSV